MRYSINHLHIHVECITHRQMLSWGEVVKQLLLWFDIPKWKRDVRKMFCFQHALNSPTPWWCRRSVWCVASDKISQQEHTRQEHWRSTHFLYDFTARMNVLNKGGGNARHFWNGKYMQFRFRGMKIAGVLNLAIRSPSSYSQSIRLCLWCILRGLRCTFLATSFRTVNRTRPARYTFMSWFSWMSMISFLEPKKLVPSYPVFKSSRVLCEAVSEEIMTN